MSQEPFSIFSALTIWGKSLPIWQHFLLSNLIINTELDEDALKAVCNEYFIDQGLADADAKRVKWDMQLPQYEKNKHDAVSTLAAVTAVSGVNVLAAGETLNFGPKLTVVYGPNGAGKSGYARLLKSACFTRSKDTEILGDVKLTKDKQPSPEAKFSFDDGSNLQFTYQEPCQRLRDGFAVFDSSCVRVHLDNRNTFQVLPYLFDVFPRMVTSFAKIQLKLREEIVKITLPQDKFSISNSTSEIAVILENLTAETNLVNLKKFAVYGEEDTARRQAIEKQILELKTADPKQIIKKNEQRVADLSTLKTSISELSNKITPSLSQSITEITIQIADLTEKGAALSVAQFASEPVQPVGTSAWKDLLKAAILYNEEVYPNDTFPPSAALESNCVLCHQKLDKNSELRLKRFFDMVTSDVETQLAQARQELKSYSVILRKMNLTFFNQGSAVRRSLQEIDAVLEVLVIKHIEGYELVINSLNQAILIESNPQVSVLEYDSILGRIDILIQNIQRDTDKLRLNDPQTLILQLLQEQQLLDDRKYLSEQYDNIVQAVNNLKWVEKANSCLRTLSNTQREVTSKQKVLAKELVAQGFIQRFTDNCKTLRLTLPVQFKFAGDAGTTDRKIEIANAELNGIYPSQVLSEGEQTAAALADFLTEIELNGACAGVVFDDPVTSMDHVRKESIAERLVDEATRRQVIVFTHDILFTNYLATAAEDKGVAFAGRTVWRNDNDEPGVIDRLAFPHEYYEGAAYDRAKKQAEAAKSLSGDPQRDALEKACGNLRTAYEDFIQKKLFNNVVRRWRENITFTLNQVYFDENIAKRVHDRMGALSRYIDAHSHSNEYQETPLTVEFIMLECATFDSIKSDYGKLRKEWEQSKPKSGFD